MEVLEQEVSASDAAKLLGISIDDLKKLEKQELLRAVRRNGEISFFSTKDIARIKSNRGLTVSQEADQVGIQLQREIAQSLSVVQKIVFLAGWGFLGYALLVVLLAIFFIFFPLQTAAWLGYIPKPQGNLSLQSENLGSNVLAAATSSLPNNTFSPIQTILQPVSRVSLGIVKYVNPYSYAQVAKVTILDTNDVLSIDNTGAMTPVLPIKIPDSSSLAIATTGLIPNLNSQYLQGKKPGINIGDIAVIGADGRIEGVPIPTGIPVQATTPAGNVVVSPIPTPSTGSGLTPAVSTTMVSGLTNANLSGGAGITNANLANSTITIVGGSGITVSGGPVSLGGSITISNAASAGVAAITGTTNQILASAATGAITLSLPQDIGASSSLSFASLNLTNTSNQLVLGTINTGTLSWSPSTNKILILPDATDTLVGKATTDILTNKSIAAGSNTISGLTAANIDAGDFSSKINAGTYAINISGNAATATTATTATNFSGPLAGDVTGTQGSTTVAKINGNTLGSTLPAAGNVLIGNGSSWITQALTGDAALTSGGVLSLKNTGTAGTYGSALNIPVFVTDAQGRVTSVTNTAVAGLTTVNFGSANISQWTNNLGYITPSSTDILTNKTIAAGSNTISGLTNANLSGTAGITNANLANSSVTITTTGPLAGGGSVSLGGTALTLNCPTCVTSGGSLFTAAATSGSNSSISQGETLTLAAGTNLTTTNNGIGTITFATIANPSFTSVNGLTLTNNGANTLSIAAGKTLTASNSLTFTGVDGTSFAFPTTSDDIVGRTVAQTLTNKSISGLTNTLTNIPNNALTNSSLTVSAGAGLANGGLVSLGGTVTLSMPNVGTAGTYGNASTIPVITTDAQGRVSGVTATGISGLTAANLTPGDFSTAIISGTYSINISGNAATATNFSGSLLGDVSGTQTTTSVDKIKGAVLGTTTATSGNLLIGNGASWVTQTLSNDATINSSGVLTLKNTGTVGTYGSALNIPVFVTDAQGRVTSVTNTTIAGLTNTNLSGTAGITNANLANSSLFLAGNSGSGSVSLGGTLTLTGAGITNVTASGSTFTLTSTEADTLQSVYGRGNAITTTSGRNIALTLPNGLVTPTSMSLTNNGIADSFLLIDAANANLGAITRRSLFINPGAITQNTAAATGTYIGLDVTMPVLTVTSGTALNANGIRVTTDGLVQTAGTLVSNGLLVDSSVSTITTGGMLNGIKIAAPTTIPSAGTYNNIFLGTSASVSANITDKATIAVGNVASTAQQNFSTLEIKNGGTGFLDMELIRGFINFQGMNTLSDDFTGNTLDINSKWTATVTGGGSSCGILAGGVGGILRMVAGTGGANRACELTTQAIGALTSGYYQRGNNPVFETKVTFNSLTNDIAYAGFTNTRVTVGSNTNPNTNHAYFAKRSTDTNWQCVTDGGAAETYTDTGVAVLTGVAYRLRVELRSGSTPETICTVDNGTSVLATTVTATQPLATSPMDVYLAIVVNANTTAKNMDVDYVRVWQDDPPLMTVNTDGNLNSTSIAVDTTNATSAAEVFASPSASLSSKDALIASDSGALINLITDAMNNVFNNLVEFFGNVIFHADVTFLGHATFNKDTAGHVLIKTGESEVSVTFEKAYAKNPVVTVSINVVGAVKPDELPGYAVYDSNTQGFKIKLSKVISSDLSFSWIALAVNVEDPVKENNLSTNGSAGFPVLSPTPSTSLQLNSNPEPSRTGSVPTPTFTVTPASTSGEPKFPAASPSAQLSP